MTVPFPADDVSSFYVGETATITLDGSFETLTGTIKTISGSNIVNTGNMIVRNVTVTVTNPGGLSSSQTATVSIGGVNCADSGTFSYQADSTVTASSSGTVTAINAKEGSSVKKNQTIVTLGGDDLENSIQSAKESLENAELSLENTQETLDDYTITSPIAGTIVDKEFKTGDKVESGDTLCKIYDLSYLQMTMDGSVVDAVTGTSIDQTYYGVVQSYSQSSSSTGSATVQTKVVVACTDGVAHTFTIDGSRTFTAGTLVSAGVTTDGTTVKTLSTQSLSGTVDSEATALGSVSFASDVQILDVSSTGDYVKIAASRLAGCTLSSVRYYVLDESGKISDLILDDATGDTWKYGYMVSASSKNSDDSTTVSGSYTYMSFVKDQRTGFLAGLAMVILYALCYLALKLLHGRTHPAGS